MSKEAMSQPATTVAVSLQNLQQWAPEIVQETENYPNYWRLKGWRCVVSH